jgi:hypothetical protein
MTRTKAAHCWVICKKIFSVSLLFNALLTIAIAIGILANFYWVFHGWKPFSPYLISGNVFWIAIVAAAINIFPSASIGRALHTGRFLFHHYFYGFLVLLLSAAYVVVFTPVSLFSIFLVNSESVAVNAGRFFLLGGLTLVLDDLPDVNTKIESSLNWLKAKAHQGGKIIFAAQLVTGAVSLYMSVAISLSISQNPQWITLANFILIGTLLVTAITSFASVKRKIWLNIYN